MERDEFYMARALELVRNALGETAPNPLVGAVVVKDGVILGEGWHHRAGEPHAEPLAIANAGDCRGATLYVTLEPCCTTGRTPPCTKRIIEAGIKRVVFGVQDANPKHVGAAVKILSDAGIQVTDGCLQEQCRRINQDFFWWIQRKRPFVTLKMAMTLDGKIATAQGESRWISGPEAQAFVQELRRRAGGVMVGGETVRKDNSSLLIHDPTATRQPRRIVWTSRPLPPDAQMLHDGGPAPELAKPQSQEEWLTFLRQLGEQNILHLLLEGGGELASSALHAGIVNQLHFFVAPKILGGRGSRPVVGGDNPLSLTEAIPLAQMETQSIGNDLLITATPTNLIA